MGRVRKGDGNITPRRLNNGKTVWDLRITIKGDVYRKHGLPTYAAAVAERDNAKRGHSAKALMGQRKVRVPEVVEAWMIATEEFKAPSSVTAQEASFRLHIKPRLDVRVGQLTVARMNTFLMSIPKHIDQTKGPRGTGYSSAKRVLDMVRAALSWAATIDVGLIESSPLKGVRVGPSGLHLPPKGKRRPSISSTLYENLLEASAGYQSQGLWVLLGASGCRRGEITALRWMDFDLNMGRLDIHRIATPESRGSRIEERVKMNQKRTVEVDDLAVQYFSALWDLRRPAKTDLIFPSPRYRDRPVSFTQIGRWWKRDCEKGGIPYGEGGASIHGLRHFFVTSLLDAKVDVAVVSKMVGHHSPTVTLSIYRDVSEAQRRQAASVMGGALRGLAPVS